MIEVTDASLKANATETLAGLRNNLSLQTMDNNGIMAEAEKLLALLKVVSQLQQNQKHKFILLI